MIIRIFILTLFIYSCSPSPKGKFGWHVQESEEVENFSNSFFNKHYTMTNHKMVFKKNSIISYFYEFESLPSKKEVLVSLNQLSLGYVEISVEKKEINLYNQISGIYRDLNIGNYKIQLSDNLEVFDSVEFEVVE